MSVSEYTKVFSGNIFLVTRIKAELEAIGIVPVIKDEGESQRLAGYASMNQGYQDVYVNNEELEKTMEIINRINDEISS
ncbi:MAG: DUF2007 domain-containing protein [Winogradskyella sp.]|uniref:putative signal transducing protein n=1 Tax=Winogradskyella sp. TaxID=1883156 RepID=UPI000F3B59B1|nr:DUF2007 domain-containing protein [Winogradskyella sp.]RNC87035.1 MAG: DUF2007 domain-containing protein [Winogradskyella sp.]